MGFCPRCGTETEQQFCQPCLRKLHPLVTNIKRITLTACPVCSRTLWKGKWTTKSSTTILEAELDRSVSYSQGSRIDEVIVEDVPPDGGNHEMRLAVIGSADADGEAYEEGYDFVVHVQGTRCPSCEKHANKYFTGIFQLRNPNVEVSSEVERLLGQSISEVKDVKGGIDYYVKDHRILQNVARQAHDRFGGELTIRAKLFSYDSLASKNLYRVNACLRLPPYWRGSLIAAGSKLVLVTGMGKRVRGVDIESGKQVSVAAKNDYPPIPTAQTTVVTVRPSVTILDPDTYQTVPVANEEREGMGELAVGASVTVANVDGRYFVVSA